MPPSLPLLVPGIRLATGDRDAEEARAIRLAREPWVAGFCLFGGEAEGVRRMTERLRNASHGPLFVASDMECGAGQQVAGLRTLPEAAVWGLAATPDEVAAFAAMTARDARSVGVDVLFAPVLDVMSEPTNPIVGSRAFGWDPTRVASLGAADLRGALRAGAVPVAKHYPGHGATKADSHDAVPLVSDEASRIEARDLLPFDAVLSAGICPAVMTAHVIYPALDPEGVVATLSRPILDRLRASARRPDGVAVFTDALCMEGVRANIGEAEAGRRALLAGCDLLLCPDDVEAVAAGLGEIPRDVLEQAAARVQAFFDTLSRARDAAVPGGDASEEASLVREVADRAVARVWAGGPEGRRVLVVDDDGVPERGISLAEYGRAAGVPVEIVRGPDGNACPHLTGGGTVVVMASVRSSKGPWGMTPEGRAAVLGVRRAARRAGDDVRFVWCGPVPPPGDLHLPGAGVELERSLAARVLPGSGAVPDSASYVRS